MEKALKTLVAAAAALALCGGAHAQNNTLATPSVKSPVAAAAATANSGYGTPGATSSDSGMGSGSMDKTADKTTTLSPAPGAGAYGSHNTLATPSVVSPANQ
ncbi:hypothetical protein [Paraburkholderia ferrariae]|uniref:hypothetical protein n=1 Tax=Paraburkholderia ferrariae TaxID=386056 RepID=UPI0004803AC8|nr:hypothetical protein [Paraburkholderia ferrariae]